MKAKVLLATDHAEMGRVWSYALQQRGILSFTVASETQAEAQWAESLPGLGIIDAYTPQLDAFALCRRLRAQAVNPLLLLCGKGDEPCILAGYEAGADECIIRPISVPLFLAKVQAWLRHAWTIPLHTLEPRVCGSLRLEPEERRLVRGNGKAVQLTNLEFRLLYMLMCYPRHVFSPGVLLDAVWGISDGDHIALKNVIYRLRHKMEPNPGEPYFIVTVPGGYSFQPD
jgi:DNA-binding response OmpR family regulator